MCVTGVGDEVTDTLFEESRWTVCKDSHMRFFNQPVICFFVLSNHLRYTWDVGTNNLEIVGDFAHAVTEVKNKKTYSRQSPAGVCSVFFCRCVLLVVTHLLFGLLQESQVAAVCSADFERCHRLFLLLDTKTYSRQSPAWDGACLYLPPLPSVRLLITTG